MCCHSIGPAFDIVVVVNAAFGIAVVASAAAVTVGPGTVAGPGTAAGPGTVAAGGIVGCMVVADGTVAPVDNCFDNNAVVLDDNAVKDQVRGQVKDQIVMLNQIDDYEAC